MRLGAECESTSEKSGIIAARVNTGIYEQYKLVYQQIPQYIPWYIPAVAAL